MAKNLFKSSVGFADSNVQYLSGEGSPSRSNDDFVKSATLGSSYADSKTGDQWTQTPSGWRKLSME